MRAFIGIGALINKNTFEGGRLFGRGRFNWKEGTKSNHYGTQSLKLCVLMRSVFLLLFSNIKFRAREMGCINAETPDMYGHYRQAPFTMIKHHWWWKVSLLNHRLFTLLSPCSSCLKGWLSSQGT